jgi:hypothetical protein
MLRVLMLTVSILVSWSSIGLCRPVEDTDIAELKKSVDAVADALKDQKTKLEAIQNSLQSILAAIQKFPSARTPLFIELGSGSFTAASPHTPKCETNGSVDAEVRACQTVAETLCKAIDYQKAQVFRIAGGPANPLFPQTFLLTSYVCYD